MPDRGSGFPYLPGRADGHAKASRAGGGGLGGFGRGAGGRSSGGQHSSRSTPGGLRDAARSLRRGGASPGGSRSGVRENGYSPRRTARDRPGGGGRDSWDEPGTAWGRSASRFGTGVRDIRDDLRERLRRNGVRGDWDTSEAPPRRLRHGGDRGGPDGPDGGPRRKGSWWRHWTWKKALTLVAALVGGVVVLGAVGVAYAYSKTPIPDVQSSVSQQASKVYFSDGKTQAGQFGSTNRVILTYNQFPVLLRNAVVAAEDKNFWHEGGISPTGIIRAAYNDLTSGDGSLQGGSTITQQLVRNYYEGIGTTQTLSRKIKEIFVAQKLAQSKSKEWILQQYMNTVLLGGNVYGVGAAAQYYFGLAPNQLSKITAAQAAMIAAMIQSPNGYSPDPKSGAAYQGLVFRWKYVLRNMEDMGTLSPQDYAQALHKFPTVVKPVNLTWDGYRGYIMQAVQNELLTTYHYSQQRIDTGGLHIVTTFNKTLMNRLYATVRSANALMRHCQVPSILSSAARATCKGLPRWVRFGAVLEDVKTGAIVAMYSGPNYNKKHCGCQYDNALLSRNQVGSSFKTYVLATAVDQGMNVQSSILNGDSPLWIPPDSEPTQFAKAGGPRPGPGYYKVVNDESGNNSLGPVRVQNATAASLNTAYTDLWHRVAYDPDTGQHPVTKMAKAFGVDTHASGLVTMEDQAGTALGQASLTVEEQATTMATLANNGVYHRPHMIKKIIVGDSVTRANPAERTVLTPNQAADVDWALSADTTAGGTAAGLGLTNGQPIIAKTGTTNLSQSAFFMGATTRYAMADALFVEHPGCTLPKSERYKCETTGALAFAPPPGLESLFGVGGLSGYGGQYPAYIWHQFFMQNFNNLPVENFLPVNNDGSKWNLYGTLPKPHHHHNDEGQQGGGHCSGLPPGQCKQGGGPSPTPSGIPTTQPTGFPTPTVTPTRPNGANNVTAARSGGPGAGALALALVVVAGPSLPLVTRLRNRRSRARRSAERQPGG
jgi:membrane peptidoglycan carboxypeptidase